MSGIHPDNVNKRAAPRPAGGQQQQMVSKVGCWNGKIDRNPSRVLYAEMKSAHQACVNADLGPQF